MGDGIRRRTHHQSDVNQPYVRSNPARATGIYFLPGVGDIFDPDHFLPKAEAQRHKLAYFPFGGGPHLCLGNRFGTLEGVLSLAMLCQKFDFELCPKQNLKPVPMTTLRPSGQMFIYVRAADETRHSLAA